MATYNTVMKKRNANNDGWDIVLPVSIAENILVGQSQIPLSEYLETKIDKSMIVQNALSTNPDTVASGPALKNVQDQVNTLTNNKANKTQPEWVQIQPLQNNWSGTAWYRRNDFGVVEFRGTIGGGAIAKDTVLFVLPIGYRPEGTRAIACATYTTTTSAMQLLVINTLGEVSIGFTQAQQYINLTDIGFAL